jgi:hypothetical protein
MKIYIHTGKGHYIGSVIIVASESYESAYNIIKIRLSQMGLESEDPQIVEMEIEDDKIIYCQSGDY